jgi:hypothetical protein
MFTDARIATAFQTMIAQTSVPPVPMSRIRQRMLQPPHPDRRIYRALAAAAAAAAIVLVAPRVAPALTDAIEAQIQAILHWTPPPPAPPAVWSAMRPRTATLAQAQSRVSFTIVAPEGLPKDAVSERIVTKAPGVYSKTTRSWSLGSPAVVFLYRRAGGRSFMLTADRYDPRSGPPSKYLFVDLDRAQNGHEVVLRRDVFTWRNGDQVMDAHVDEGISAPEIAAIRTAMHGTIVSGVWPRPEGTSVTQYRIP